MIKVVIFDADGMLLHGPLFSEVYSKRFGVPMEEIVPFFAGPFQNCITGELDLKEELEKGWLEKWNWKEGTEKFLELWFSIGDVLDKKVFDSIRVLQEKGKICLLATNQEKYRLQYISEKFSFNTALDGIFSACNLKLKKPTPEFFDEVMKYLKEKNSSIEKSNVVFWDDDIKNVEGAKTYGFVAEQFTDPEIYLEKIKSYESRN
jgi:FMN phosphatase YigB (HAD superfamily)